MVHNCLYHWRNYHRCRASGRTEGQYTDGADWVSDNGELTLAGDWLTQSGLLTPPFSIEALPGKIILRTELEAMQA
ncbi:SymE family type I addiction module toxin [Dickeya zeae]|uniref:SymE family type I addiction module toxin n=1 Tax=Dickeya zeae TaxID=204042 RepID=UPI0003A1773E|nr:SymE family type I addiction module toxin [Dickeya zeae]